MVAVENLRCGTDELDVHPRIARIGACRIDIRAVAGRRVEWAGGVDLGIGGGIERLTAGPGLADAALRFCSGRSLLEKPNRWLFVWLAPNRASPIGVVAEDDGRLRGGNHTLEPVGAVPA